MLPSPQSPPPAPSPCFGLLLAAGSSRRFGSDKRLHELPDGQRLAIATLRNWSQAIAADGLTQLFVVTRGAAPAGDNPTDLHPDPLTEHITQTGIAVTVIAAQEHALGMGHSLAAAVPLIPPGPLIVGLADMPFVQPDTLRRLAHALSTASASAIVRPSFKGQPGNPIGFGAALRAALANSTGDAGARSLVKDATQNNRVIDLPVADPGVINDIDRPSDLAEIRI